MRAKLILLLSLSFVLNAGFAQVRNEAVLESTNSEELFRLADLWKAKKAQTMPDAIKKAKERGLPLREVSDDGAVMELQGLDERGELIYYVTDNRDAARTLSTDELYPGGSLGLNLTGSTMTAGEWDGGAVRSSHVELTGGRVTQVDSSTSISDHATHVAGTIIGSGVDTSARGMAYAADLDAYDWTNDDAEMASAAANGLLISNHSYGRITGWYGGNYWFGDTTLSANEDYKFGFYESQARAWDLIARNAPYYLIVKSAGNDRGDSGTAAHYLYLHGVNSTTPRNADGGPQGYDCISTYSGAKNILTVGAVGAIPGGYSGPSSVVMSSFSGWGPTDDGRIKPDVVGNGVGVYSCLGSSDSAYASWNGTSMASPNVTGSMLLLQELYYNENNAYMKSATLKGLVIHTADEAGAAPGPDYQHGWGLMNTKRAAEHIIDSTGTKSITESSLTNSNTYTFNVTVNGFTPIRATLCWTDVPGTPVSAALDPSTPMLVNDLDIRIIRNSDSTVYSPYKLNPGSPGSAATNGDNTVDNVEQIYLSSPSAGTYTVVISHKGTLSGGSSQDFSLIFDGGIPPAQPLNCLSQVTAPFYWDFDTLTNCSSTAGSACPLPTWFGWQNDTLDDIDWTVRSGSTPSTGTGPTADYNSTGSGKYLYTEASSSGTGYPGKQAILYTPCIDLDTLVNAELAFAYHMYGSDMGTISAEVFNGFTWNQVWTASGDQGNNWSLATADLSNYDGDTIQIRFVGSTGNNFRSDMAIDAVEIREQVPCPDPYNVSVYNITDSTAEFTWSGSASWAHVRIDLHDSTTLIPATMINFNPVVVSGLNPNTEYDIYIQDSCSNGEFSNWVGPIVFKTTGPISNPSTCGLAAQIPDNNCPNQVYLRVDVSAPGTQLGTDVSVKEVKLIIDHTYTGDLSFALASPAGDTVVLSNLNGGSGDDFGNPADATCSQTTTFSMSASTSITTGTAPFIGSYTPEESFNNFNTGSNPNGIWKFIVCDDFAGDVGTLEYFEIIFDSVCTDPTVGITNSGNDTICSGSSTVLKTSGGVSYQWYQNGVVMAGQTADSLVVSGSGNYNVMVTVAGGCDDSASTGKRITVNNLPNVSITNNGQAAFCADDSTLLQTSGGGSYQWYRNGLALSGQTGTSLNVSSSGSYNVLVTDITGCSDSSLSAEVITVHPLPNVIINSNVAPNFCFGGSATLSTISGSSFQWYLDGSPLVGATSPTYIASDSGWYNVVVTDSNSCSDSSSGGLLIQVYSLPDVSIAASGDTTFCNGDSVTLSTNPLFNQFQWYRNGVPIAGASSFSEIARLGGIYNVLVTDLNNCSDSARAGKRVKVNPLPLVGIIYTDTTLCDGDSILLSATPGFSYNWRRNGFPISGANASSIYVKEAGYYNVVAVDQNFCSDTSANGVSVIVFDLPVVTLDPQPEYCNTDGAKLLSGGQPAGGVYSGTAVSDTSGLYFFSPGTAGVGMHEITYTFTDANGCISADSDSIRVKNCVGIDELASGQVSIYPNPSKGQIFIELSQEITGNAVVLLYDAVGALILNRAFEEIQKSGRLNLDLSGLSSGTYFLHLQTGQAVYRQKLILDKN